MSYNILLSFDPTDANTNKVNFKTQNAVNDIIDRPIWRDIIGKKCIKAAFMDSNL